MPPTTDYEFGDVVLVAFPFTDQSGSKKRPAVVVSSAAFHRHRADLILMPVTSRIGKARPGDVQVSGWEAAGLLMPSLVKPAMATLEKEMVLEKLGRLEAEDRQALRKAIDAALGS